MAPNLIAAICILEAASSREQRCIGVGDLCCDCCRVLGRKGGIGRRRILRTSHEQGTARPDAVFLPALALHLEALRGAAAALVLVAVLATTLRAAGDALLRAPPLPETLALTFELAATRLATGAEAPLLFATRLGSDRDLQEQQQQGGGGHAQHGRGFLEISRLQSTIIGRTNRARQPT